MWQGDPGLGNFRQWNEESQAVLSLHEDIGTLHAPATDSLHPQVSTMNTVLQDGSAL